MSSDEIIEIKTLEELMEMASMTSGAVHGSAGSGNIKVRRKKKMKQNEQQSSEKIIRLKVRSFLKGELNKEKRLISEQKKNENALRLFVRQMLKEGDLSDTHPNRSTGINTLEDVLKKSIPTLRVDYKKLTTDKRQRDSFRAHVIKAVIDAIKPQQVNASYLQGDVTGAGSSLLSEPTGGGVEEEEEGEAALDAELEALEEAEIEIDVEEDPDDKKIPVEADDEPSPEEQFGTGLEDQDETGRNHAYTSYRKISQYVLDAYDSLANPKDKEVFLDYLVTNLKLYFDKFEDELQKTVEEPTTPEYDKVKAEA